MQIKLWFQSIRAVKVVLIIIIFVLFINGSKTFKGLLYYLALVLVEYLIIELIKYMFFHI